MFEFPRSRRRHSAVETAADSALLEGDYRKAEATLHEGIRRTYTHQPDAYHHLALKAVALPLYELASSGATPERLEDARSVYGWTGNLLDSELAELQSKHHDYRAYGRYIGNISELVIFGLLARAFEDDTSLVALPATRADDTAPSEGTDFYIVSPQAADDVIRLQVKTKLKDDTRMQYVGSDVRLVGLNEIDPRFDVPAREDSLAQRMLRELAGTGDDDNAAALDAATDKLFALIAEQAPYRTAS